MLHANACSVLLMLRHDVTLRSARSAHLEGLPRHPEERTQCASRRVAHDCCTLTRAPFDGASRRSLRSLLSMTELRSLLSMTELRYTRQAPVTLRSARSARLEGARMNVASYRVLRLMVLRDARYARSSA